MGSDIVLQVEDSVVVLVPADELTSPLLQRQGLRLAARHLLECRLAGTHGHVQGSRMLVGVLRLASEEQLREGALLRVFCHATLVRVRQAALLSEPVAATRLLVKISADDLANALSDID